jgi:hypothetical protein
MPTLLYVVTGVAPHLQVQQSTRTWQSSMVTSMISPYPKLVEGPHVHPVKGDSLTPCDCKHTIMFALPFLTLLQPTASPSIVGEPLQVSTSMPTRNQSRGQIVGALEESNPTWETLPTTGGSKEPLRTLTTGLPWKSKARARHCAMQKLSWQQLSLPHRRTDLALLLHIAVHKMRIPHHQNDLALPSRS